MWRSDLSAAAYQMDASTNRLMLSARPAALEGKCLCNHFILIVGAIGIFGNIGAAGLTEIKKRRGATCRSSLAEIARRQAPNVFGQRYAEITGPLARAALRVERDLGPCHHDDIIIPTRCWPALRRRWYIAPLGINALGYH